MTRIMTKNMEDLLWRGDSLDRMSHMSSSLRDESLKYRKAARKIVSEFPPVCCWAFRKTPRNNRADRPSPSLPVAEHGRHDPEIRPHGRDRHVCLCLYLLPLPLVVPIRHLSLELGGHKCCVLLERNPSSLPLSLARSCDPDILSPRPGSVSSCIPSTLVCTNTCVYKNLFLSSDQRWTREVSGQSRKSN